MKTGKAVTVAVVTAVAEIAVIAAAEIAVIAAVEIAKIRNLEMSTRTSKLHGEENGVVLRTRINTAQPTSKLHAANGMSTLCTGPTLPRTGNTGTKLSIIALMGPFRVETDLEKVAEAVIMMHTRLHSMPKMHTHMPTSSAIVIRALQTGLGRHITGDSMKSLDTAPCFLDTFPSQHFPC